MSKAEKIFNKFASRGGRVLQKILGQAEGFAGHRTKNITSVLEQGLKPASELTEHTGVTQRELKGSSILTEMAGQLQELLNSVRDKGVGTKTIKKVRELADFKTTPFMNVEELGKFKGTLKDYYGKINASTPESLKTLEESAENNKKLKDLDIPYIWKTDIKSDREGESLLKTLRSGDNNSVLKKLEEGKDTSQRIFMEQKTRPYSDDSGSTRLDLGSYIASYLNKKNNNNPYIKKGLNRHKEFFNWRGDKQDLMSTNPVSKFLIREGVGPLTYLKPQKFVNELKSQRQDNIDALRRNIAQTNMVLGNEGTRAAFKNRNDIEAIKNLVSNSQYVKSKMSAEFSYANPEKAGAPHVFFMRDTIFKPSKEGVGEYGVIMPTRDVKAQSSEFTTLQKDFAGQVKKDKYKSSPKPIHKSKYLGQELSGRPEDISSGYKLDNSVVVIPKKEWSTFSKNNPGVNKIREDKARKLLLRNKTPMVTTEWANKK